MKVACLFKWARNPGDAWVNPDGSVVWRGAKMVASDDDAAAIVFAREVAEATGGELTGVTIGDGDASWALARGAQRVVSIPDVAPSPDDASTAASLAAAVRHAGEFDLVLMGDAQDHPGVAGTLGALLGMPVLLGVQGVTVHGDDSLRLLARRRVGTGLETLGAPSPVLAAVAAESTEKDVPGVRQLMDAHKRPIEKAGAVEAGAPGLEAVTLIGSRVPDSHVARIFDGDPASAARDLISSLTADGVL